MNVFQRAVLYLIRKKVRSILLFLILFSMGLFMLTGLSIRSSADKAAVDMQRTIATGLDINMIPIDGSKIYDLSYNEKGELVRTLIPPMITESVAMELASVEGVSGFYAAMGEYTLYTGLDVHPGEVTLTIENCEENGVVIPDDMQASDERYLHSNDFRVVMESQYYPHFRNGALELIEGRHIHREDSGKIMISEELAERNNLKIGDIIDGRSFDFMNGELYGETYHAEIVGIFRINFEQQNSDGIAEPSLLTNTIFAPFELRYWGQVQYNSHYGRNVLAKEEDRLLGSITIFVDNPDDLDSIEQKIRENEHVDWSYYTISRYDQDYKAAAKPLLSMVLLAVVMVVVMIVGSLIILSLILAMWVRGRKQETDILLSLGISERTILAQFLIEIGLIAVAAFLLAFTLAAPTTHMIGNALTEFMNPAEDASSFLAEFDITTGFTTVTRTAVRQDPLSYTLTFGEVILTFVAMITVSAGTIVSAFLRMRGKTLLTGKASDIHHWKFQRWCDAGEMKAHHRAVLYVTRKTGKSMLLLFTLSVISILLLFGLSIRFASQQAAESLRESIGGYFRVSTDYTKADVKNQVDQNLIDHIMASGEIKDFNAMDVCYMDALEFTLIPGKFSGEGDKKANMTKILGNMDTSLHEYFSLEIFELTEGRHVEETDTGKALISEELAEWNHLKLGDHLTLQIPEEDVDHISSIKSYDLEIIGLYHEVQKTPVSEQTMEYNIPDNFIFTDIATTQQMMRDLNPGKNEVYSGGAIFYVRDPKKINKVVQEIEESGILDPNYTKLSVNNAAYHNSMEPLERLENMSLLILALILVIGTVLLTLILTLWERDRIYEAGILMSFGIPKINIWWQHFLECISVFLIAFGLSVTVLLAVGPQAGDRIYKNVSEQIESMSSGVTQPVNETVNADLIESDTSFHAGVQPAGVFSAGFAGILLIGFSTGTAFLVIARHKPKELLAILE